MIRAKEWKQSQVDNDRSWQRMGRVITARRNRTGLLKCKLIGVRLTKQPAGHRRDIAGFRFRDPHRMRLNSREEEAKFLIRDAKDFLFFAKKKKKATIPCNHPDRGRIIGKRGIERNV